MGVRSAVFFITFDLNIDQSTSEGIELSSIYSDWMLVLSFVCEEDTFILGIIKNRNSTSAVMAVSTETASMLILGIIIFK